MRNIILGHLVTVTASPICPRFDGFDRDIDFSVHRAGTEAKVGYHLCVLYQKIFYSRMISLYGLHEERMPREGRSHPEAPFINMG